MLCSPHPRSMFEITAPLHCSNLTNDIMCRIKHRPSDEKKHVCHCPHRNGEEHWEHVSASGSRSGPRLRSLEQCKDQSPED
ncbi:hypothetical protein MHYP_G00067320 [Metynnis hypsauchen]